MMGPPNHDPSSPSHFPLQYDQVQSQEQTDQPQPQPQPQPPQPQPQPQEQAQTQARPEPEPRQETQPSTSTSQNPAPPRRVCAACRRRKVGCDKKQPCQNCKKSNAECIYPPDPRTAARQALPDAQVWEHLRRLEPILKTLVDSIDQDPSHPATASSVFSALLPGLPAASQAARPTSPSRHPDVSSGPVMTQPVMTQAVMTQPVDAEMDTGQRAQAQSYQLEGAQATGAQPVAHASLQSRVPYHQEMETDAATVITGSGSSSGRSPLALDPMLESISSSWSPYGRTVGKLVKDDGKRRYVSGHFWETLHTAYTDPTQDDDMTEDSEYEYEAPPQQPESSSFHYSLLFDSCASPPETATVTQHPPELQRYLAWQLFKENVQPVVTVLHIPSIEPSVMEGMRNPQNLPPPLEALIFVVYFAAVNSLPADTCMELFGAEQSAFLASLRRSVDRAFARAELMETDNMLVLQAFVVYLVALRSYNPACSYNLTGLAARLAQSFGMHRDGRKLGLTPFETEIRRRLWWGICVLDTPASEDHSCSSNLMEISSFDSPPPLNINDADLHPNMTELPEQRIGLSETSFTVARCWMTDMWRTMIDIRRTDPNMGKSFVAMTLMEKEMWVDGQHDRLMQLLFGGKQSTEPLQSLIQSFIGTVFCNLRLFIYNPLGAETTLTEPQRKRVLQNAVDCMSNSYRLQTNPRVAHWTWLTRCFNEWYAFAVVISELCEHPLSKDADRTWRVVERSAVLRWDSAQSHRRVHQWRSVMKGIEKARRRRRKELGRRQSTSSSSARTIVTRGSNIVITRPREPNLTPADCTAAMQNGAISSQNAPLVVEPDSTTVMDTVHVAPYPIDKGDGGLDRMDSSFNFGSVDSQLYFDPAMFTSNALDSLLALGSD